MIELKVVLVFALVNVVLCVNQYPVFDKYCKNIDITIRQCSDQFNRDTPTPDKAAINLKISGVSILEPSNYFTIIPEICKYKNQYIDFMACAYQNVQSCLPTEFEQLLPPFQNLTEAFNYMCRYYNAKEFTIQCYQNNTLQGPKPEDRIRKFTEVVERCVIDKRTFIPITQTVTTDEDREKIIRNHCIYYNAGYECVYQTFATRCFRTRDHIKVFYDYMRPERCSGSYWTPSLLLILLIFMCNKFIF